MTGKEKCIILKDLRNKIALANGIDFISSECDFEGECLGYCPKCDDEIKFLENALQEKCGLDLDGLLDKNMIEDTSFMEELLKEYVIFPDDDDNDEGVMGLMGDIVPDDIDNDW